MSELGFVVIDNVEDLDNLTVGGYPMPERKPGPVKWLDKEMTCASRRCGSPTYRTFKGVPYCFPHIFEKINELFVQLGVQR